MKKALAVVLIVLILLNTMGYYGVFLGLKYQNFITLNEQLDDETYSLSDAITIEVPLSLPYYPDTEYRRVEGQIEYKGEFFHLVKQKYEKNTLFIVCVKDSKAKDINKAISDYVKTFTDHASDAASSKVAQSLIKDYTITDFTIDSSSLGWSQPISYTTSDAFLISHLRSILSPPPEA